MSDWFEKTHLFALLCLLALISSFGCDGSSARASGEDVNSGIHQFFSSLDDKDGSESLELLGDSFAISDEQRAALGAQIDDLSAAVGPPSRFVVVSRLRIENLDELYTVFVYSIHKRGVALWELTVLELPDQWLILRLKFSGDDSLDRARELGIAYVDREVASE